MEWVEVQGKTIDLAVEVAMAELGAASRDDVDVEVIQEPKAGFLGMGGQEAIVKVTKAAKKRRRSRGRGRSGNGGNGPKAQSPSKASSKGSSKGDRSSGGDGGGRRSEPSKSGGGKRQGATMSASSNDSDQKPKKTSKDRSDDRPEELPIEQQAEVAEDFITGLLGAFGLEGDATSRVEDDILYLNVSGPQTEALVGPKGAVMQNVLELTRTVVQRKTYGAPRMRIDIAGYAERRREALKIYAGKLSQQVIEDQSEVMLEPMNAADRKVLHDAVAEIDGVRSYSEGEDPKRAVVIAYDGD